jgi:beta-carotene ketolase (CrtO type)
MYDDIVIGAGLNGLVAASSLADKGHKVLVLEKNDIVGGVNITRSFPKYPDVKFDLGAIYPSMIRSNPKFEEFNIEKDYGVKFLESPVAFTHLYPETGKYIELTGDNEYVARQLGELAGEKEAENWMNYAETFGSMLEMMGGMLYGPAPSIDSLLELLPMMGGAEEVADLARWALVPLNQVVDEFFDSEYAKGILLKFGGTMGAYAFEGGTGMWGCMALMIAGMGYVEGGTGKLLDAFAQAATDRGAEIRLNAPVKKIIIEGDQARGVEMADGEVIEARNVISCFDTKNTYFDLIGEDKLDDRFVHRLKAVPAEHAAFLCVHLVLDEKPDLTQMFPGIDNDRALSGSLILCPSKAYNDRFQREIAAQRVPEHPVWWSFTPSVIDPSMAPEGLYPLSIESACPIEFAEGTWDENIKKYTDNMIESYLEIAPNLRGHIVDVEIQSPEEIKQRNGAQSGNLYTLDQGLGQIMMFRPVPEIADGHTQFKNLYFGCQGVHPFGGANGVGGMNAADLILEEQE